MPKRASLSLLKAISLNDLGDLGDLGDLSYLYGVKAKSK